MCPSSTGGRKGRGCGGLQVGGGGELELLLVWRRAGGGCGVGPGGGDGERKEAEMGEVGDGGTAGGGDGEGKEAEMGEGSDGGTWRRRRRQEEKEGRWKHLAAKGDYDGEARRPRCHDGEGRPRGETTS